MNKCKHCWQFRKKIEKWKTEGTAIGSKLGRNYWCICIWGIWIVFFFNSVTNKSLFMLDISMAYLESGQEQKPIFNFFIKSQIAYIRIFSLTYAFQNPAELLDVNISLENSRFVFYTPLQLTHWQTCILIKKSSHPESSKNIYTL